MKKEPFAEHGLTVFERGWLSSNNILMASPGVEETILVDSGYATHASQTLALVRQELGERRLSRIINTHLHSDHCGGNACLQAEYGCEIDVPIGEAAKVDSWDAAALSFVPTGQQCSRFQRTGVVSPGDRITHGSMTWEVLAAPGHDPESVILYEERLRWLMSADALWANGFGVVFPEILGEPGFDDVRRTLNLIASLSVSWVIPGHGAPFSDVSAAMGRAKMRLDGLQSNPAKHALHAAKVLIKFHLLEVRSVAMPELQRWLGQVRYVAALHELFFRDRSLQAWCADLVQDLVNSGAARIDSGMVFDI